MCENMSFDVTLDQHRHVHGDASFHMTSFKSAHGQVAVWCKYSSSKTGDRIASYFYDSSLQLAVVS